MESSRIFARCSALVCVLAGAPSALAGIVYVDASATSGADDGTSWSDAFQGPSGLRRALAAAASGDEIWVADGTYLPTLSGVRTRSFDLKTNVKLYGGFAGGETSLSQRDPSLHIAVLSGDLAGDDAGGNYGDNSYHVVAGRNLGFETLLDGFTIRGGNADGPSASSDDGGGGLLFVSGQGAPVRQCVFESNRCTGRGGAVYSNGSCCSQDFHECRFADNHAGVAGGAVQLINAEGIHFTRCVFTGNSAPNGSAADFFLAFDVFLDTCLLYGNTATGGSPGATVNAYLESYLWVDSSTVVANSSITGFAGLRSYADSGIWNSIVYFNGGGTQLSGFPYAAYCCVQGGFPGTAMISADPLFVDLPNSDFHLSPSSPCVDAGENDASASLDLDKAPRFQDVTSAPDGGLGTAPIVDMGAYETPGGLYDVFCAGDGSLATACPCANFGYEATGCRNSDSQYPYLGGLLAAAGASSPDSVVLTSSHVPPGRLCIFLQSDTPLAAGVVFGDGVRCLGGSLKRIGAKLASTSGVASYPAAGDPSVSVRSTALGDPIQSGSDRWYQTWYRDGVASFCPAPQGGTSNVSSGIIVHW
jgi:predicted outer membrane repeat protein